MVNDIYNAAHEYNGMKICIAVVEITTHLISKIHCEIMIELMKPVFKPICIICM